MSIKHIILGYLDWKPQSGYDLKRVIADSETLDWSANNNQIYKALVELHNDGFVSKDVQHQDGSPSRHHYSITEAGLNELKSWVLTTPEAPYSKKSILIRLMWGDCLSKTELEDLLDRYLNVVGEKLFMLRVQAAEKPNMPDRTKRELYLWEMINKNWLSHYELELSWVKQVQQELANIN